MLVILQSCQDLQIPMIKAKRRICEALLHPEQLSSMQGRHQALFGRLGSHGDNYPWFLTTLLSSTMAFLISMGPVPAWRHFSAFCSPPQSTDGELRWPSILLGCVDTPIGGLPLLPLRRVVEAVCKHFFIITKKRVKLIISPCVMAFMQWINPVEVVFTTVSPFMCW